MRLFFSIIILLLSSSGARAQQAANLIADRIEITPNGVLLASGLVTVWFGKTQVTASEISYSSEGGQLKITGPIHLTDGSETVILADQATLSQDLSRGIIKSAKIILSKKVQIASTQVSRLNSRYSQAYNVWFLKSVPRLLLGHLSKRLIFSNSLLTKISPLPQFYLRKQIL